jgi:hypothetical protein
MLSSGTVVLLWSGDVVNNESGPASTQGRRAGVVPPRFRSEAQIGARPLNWRISAPTGSSYLDKLRSLSRSQVVFFATSATADCTEVAASLPARGRVLVLFIAFRSSIVSRRIRRAGEAVNLNVGLRPTGERRRDNSLSPTENKPTGIPVTENASGILDKRSFCRVMGARNDVRTFEVVHDQAPKGRE